MNLAEAIKKNEFVITAEIFPPKGSDLSESLKKALDLKGFVHAINVTDNQRAVMRMNPVVLCHQLVHNGMDSVYQMCCRDRNSMGLSSDILAASAMGIKNILAITGDYPARNGKMLAKPVFEIDSVQLVSLIKKLESGFDHNDLPLSSNPSFNVGAVVNPNSEQIDLQVLKLQKKVNAGATYIQTQVVYDVEGFKKFREKSANINAKIFLGIFPLKSFATATFMAHKVPGVKVPDHILKRMENAKDQEKEGFDIAIETIRSLRQFCDGVHLMTMNDTSAVKRIVASI